MESPLKITDVTTTELFYPDAPAIQDATIPPSSRGTGDEASSSSTSTRTPGPRAWG